jgi:hypothetical protein
LRPILVLHWGEWGKRKYNPPTPKADREKGPREAKRVVRPSHMIVAQNIDKYSTLSNFWLDQPFLKRKFFGYSIDARLKNFSTNAVVEMAIIPNSR